LTAHDLLRCGQKWRLPHGVHALQEWSGRWITTRFGSPPQADRPPTLPRVPLRSIRRGGLRSRRALRRLASPLRHSILRKNRFRNSL
jgi:hypothetical protein